MQYTPAVKINLNRHQPARRTRRTNPIPGSSRIANTPESGCRCPNGHERSSIPATGVRIVSVKLDTAPSGGRYCGFSDAVAPTGVPCTASVIGLAIAVPTIPAEKLNVAALPAATICVVAPVAASVKSAAAPTVTFVPAEMLGRKFPSPEYAALKLCEPNASALVLNAAVPPASCTTDSTAVPSITVTLPDGTPLVVLAAWTFSVIGPPRLNAAVDVAADVSVGACAIVKLAGNTLTV